jgi:hypothetical protein
MGIAEDRQRLLDLLDVTARVIRWTVTESGLIHDRELLERFTATLGQVDDRVRDVQEIVSEELSGDPEESPLYEELEHVGLTAAQLSLKERVLQWIVTAAGGELRQVLAWINTFLGSLAQVIPAVDLVKEYKEHLEIVIDIQHRRPAPTVPPTILGLR